MNKAEELARMLSEPSARGGKSKIAVICGVTLPAVTRWMASGRINPRYNNKIRRGLSVYSSASGRGTDWLNKALDLLQDDACPTCGKPWGDHDE